MYVLKKSIFIKGKPAKAGDVVELDRLEVIELGARGIIEKHEPLEEVLIRPKKEARAK